MNPPSDVASLKYITLSFVKFINLLLKGETGYITPVPEGVGLRTLYLIEKQSMLVVDFTDELINKFPSGSSAENFVRDFVDPTVGQRSIKASHKVADVLRQAAEGEKRSCRKRSPGNRAPYKFIPWKT